MSWVLDTRKVVLFCYRQSYSLYLAIILLATMVLPGSREILFIQCRQYDPTMEMDQLQKDPNDGSFTCRAILYEKIRKLSSYHWLKYKNCDRTTTDKDEYGETALTRGGGFLAPITYDRIRHLQDDSSIKLKLAGNRIKFAPSVKHKGLNFKFFSFFMTPKAGQYYCE